MKGRRGVALVTVLLLSVIMLILGVSFLYYLERDYRFAGQQDRSQQAFYLARAGLQYARSRPDLCYPGMPAKLTRSIPLGEINPSRYFDIYIDATGRLTSTGVLKSPLGPILAQRDLVVEPSTPVRLFRDKAR